MTTLQTTTSTMPTRTRPTTVLPTVVVPTVSAPTVVVPTTIHRTPPPGLLQVLAKALLDRVLALVGLLVLVPLFVVLAAAVKLSGPGPVLYRERRIGLRGRPFTILKFRSMVTGADRLLVGLVHQHDGNEVQFKLRRDPRVTRVGRVLRRWSLDELPQLVNVLRGEMSLVGPRPHSAREVAAYAPPVVQRLSVKPGITGPWQVNGRSDLSWSEAVEHDLAYVATWTLSADLRILARTVRAVSRGSGAY